MPAGPTAKMAVLLRGCDFNFFENVFLSGTYLFETNQLQEREKRDHDFDTRCGSRKQIRKTQGDAGRYTLYPVGWTEG